MNPKALREHRTALDAFAKETEASAAALPDDWWLSAIAQNQRDNAEDAARKVAIAEALDAGELLEWRFVGNRLRLGALPLEFLSRVAAPLNNLLLRAAYFARNKTEAMYGAADDLSRELALSVVGVAPGSTRLFIRGNALPDLTGKSALSDGIEGLFDVLAHSSDFQQFYEHLDDIGERASEALHDTLKALETEECSVEVRWHRPDNHREFSATYDRVVQMRALLQGIGEAQERHERLSGRITLLSVNGRLQLELDNGRRAAVRFKPRTQAGLVAALTLNAPVTLDVSAKVTNDPISGEEIKRYSLVSLDSPLLLGKSTS
ncbi:MAG: hypothetical protein QM750_11735 [Rubrivivax sp.]